MRRNWISSTPHDDHGITGKHSQVRLDASDGERPRRPSRRRDDRERFRARDLLRESEDDADVHGPRRPRSPLWNDIPDGEAPYTD